MSNLTVTEIRKYVSDDGLSVGYDIIIDDKYLMQIGDDDSLSIPTSDETGIEDNDELTFGEVEMLKKLGFSKDYIYNNFSPYSMNLTKVDDVEQFIADLEKMHNINCIEE